MSDHMYLVSTLTIYNATLNDSGTYTCTISAPGWKSSSDSMDITIKGKESMETTLIS